MGVPQLLLGSLLVTRQSAIGQFFPVPKNGPRGLSGPVFLLIVLSGECRMKLRLL